MDRHTPVPEARHFLDGLTQIAPDPGQSGSAVSHALFCRAVVGHPNAVKLGDPDVICAVPGCEGELLIAEPGPATPPGGEVGGCQIFVG